MRKQILFTMLIAGLAAVTACGGSSEKGKKAQQDTLKAADSLAAQPDGLSPQEEEHPFRSEAVFFSGGIVDGEYLHLTDMDNEVPQARINASMDSIVARMMGTDLKDYIQTPATKDSLRMRMEGEITLTHTKPHVFGGLVSFPLRVNRFGMKTPDTHHCFTFDLETGRRVMLSDLVGGGAPMVLSMIRRQTMMEDAQTRYDCALSPTWNQAEDFHVASEGLRWQIEEQAFPDRKFCQKGVDLLLDWKVLEPVLIKGTPVVDNLLQAVHDK